MRRALLALALVLAAAGLARGAAATDLFTQANQDYARQRYQAAVAEYEELLATGTRHASLHYNLGNAYFRLAQNGEPDRIGRAILAYERALALDPGFEDAPHPDGGWRSPRG